MRPSPAHIGPQSHIARITVAPAGAGIEIVERLAARYVLDHVRHRTILAGRNRTEICKRRVIVDA